MAQTDPTVHPAGRVAWARLSGEEVEEVVAIFVCREHPRSNKVRPSRGDGGVDILVPPKPGESFSTVYQIKSFSGPGLTSSQKRQISDSLTQVRHTQKDQLERWNLVVPMDPTPEQVAWFGELTRDCPFECNWYGFTHLDSLAAKYDEVVDYYLRGGRAAVEKRMHNLLDATRLVASSSMSAAESQTGLVSVLKTINATDPHFSFEFSVSTDPEGFSATDGYVAKFVFTPDRENFVTVVMRAKYDEALNDRPIPIHASLRIDTPHLRSDFHELVNYGIGEVTTTAEVTYPSGLPGGFDIRLYEPVGLLRIGPSSRIPAEIVLNELAIHGPQDQVVAKLSVTCKHLGGGFRGVSIVLTDESQALTITLICDDEDQDASSLQIAIDPTKFIGVPVMHCLAVMHFVDAIKSGNRLAFLIQHGGVLLRTRNLDVDFVSPFLMFRNFLIDLATLQSGCVLPIRFPSKASAAEVHYAGTAAKLILGEQVECNWTEMHLYGAEVGQQVPSNQLVARVQLPQMFTFALSGDEIWSCPVTATITNAVTHSSFRNDDGTYTLRLVPGEGSSMSQAMTFH
jgi:hypothetical protein